MYRKGEKVAQNNTKAFKWFKEAAKNRMPEAQYELGKMYEEVEQNYTEAIKWYRAAANQGLAEAWYALGAIYEVMHNYQEAFKCYKNATKQGVSSLQMYSWASSKAQLKIGAMYHDGLGTTRNKDKAFKWYIKAAESGVAEVQYTLGRFYIERMAHANWNEIIKCQNEAIKWFAEAAKQGHEEAQFFLGTLYYFSLEDDDKEAFYWHTKSAEQGNIHAEFMVKNMYVQEKRTNEGLVKAVQRYIEADKRRESIAPYILMIMTIYLNASQDNTTSLPRNNYAENLSVKQDDIEMIEEFKMAAEEGDVFAQYNLGQMYLNGDYVDRDDFQAFKWFFKAAGQGYLEAQMIVDYVNPHL